MATNSDNPVGAFTPISQPGQQASRIRDERLRIQEARRTRIGQSLTDASQLDILYAQEAIASGRENVRFTPKGIFYSDMAGSKPLGSVLDTWAPDGKLARGSVLDNWDPSGRLAGGGPVKSLLTRTPQSGIVGGFESPVKTGIQTRPSAPVSVRDVTKPFGSDTIDMLDGFNAQYPSYRLVGGGPVKSLLTRTPQSAPEGPVTKPFGSDIIDMLDGFDAQYPL